MHRLAESKLLAGFIYGDPHMQEYIYLPASELDAASPMLVYETGKERHDVPERLRLDGVYSRLRSGRWRKQYGEGNEKVAFSIGTD